MAQPEKDPASKFENSADNEALSNKPPELDAILPDDIPPAAAELIEDLDSYQKKVHDQWDKAKSSYQEKINQIMEDFLKQTMSENGEAANFSPPPSKKPKEKTDIPHFSSSRRDPAIASLLAHIEEELERTRHKKRIPFFDQQPPMLGLPWKNQPAKFSRKRILVGLGVVVVVICSWFFWKSVQVPPVSNLPYTHTLGPVIKNGNVYILDWFRKVLYVHEFKKGLAIRSVENIPSNLATGLALSDKHLWTLDTMERKIVQHTASMDHQVVNNFESPAEQPSGLYFDGTDLWSADTQSKKLYRHRGNDIEDIRDTFPLPDLTPTGLVISKNRAWILDGKSRTLGVYRLQKSLKEIALFDLDPFLNGATPTGVALTGKTVWLTTENPSQLLRIKTNELKKNKPDEDF